MGMMEARIRILTNNTQTPILSPQEVVSCSQYAQGMCCISGTVYLCVVCHCWQSHKDGIVERAQCLLSENLGAIHRKIDKMKRQRAMYQMKEQNKTPE